MASEETAAPKDPQTIRTEHLMKGAFKVILVGAIALLYWLFRIGTDISPPAPVLILLIFVPICVVWEFISYRRERRKVENV